jgi:peptide/nickel transport system substrate-binding protein
LVVIPGLQTAFLDNFNPLSASAMTGTFGLIYQPLFYFNTVGPQVYPLLGRSYKWSANNTVLTVKLRTGAKWSNGSPVTASDVVYSYTILHKDPSLDVNGVWSIITSVAAVNSSTVKFVFKTPDVPFVSTLLGSIPIIPESVWAHIAKPGQSTNPHPIGSGPYVLKTFNPETVTFAANPDYWGGKPKVETVEYLQYSDNNSATLALTSGQVDWTSLFIPNINKIYVDKNPHDNHYWFSLGGPLMLYTNLKNPLLSPLPVRKAIAYAINRTALWKVGEYGYEPPATTPTALALPLNQSWMDPALAHLKLTYNTSKSVQILEKAGYKKNAKGIFVSPSGKPLDFTIIVPSGWSDWDEDCSLMSQELLSVGIKATVEQLAYGAYYSDLSTGHYTLGMSWTSSGTTPYYLYDGLLGKGNPNNFENWNNPVTTRDLNELKATSSPTTEKRLMDQLETMTANNLPAIPLVYGASWYEYSSQYFTGWPTASNPYAAPQPYTGPAQAIVITHLTPRK